MSFNGRLWVMGGWDSSPRNDVWSSADGITWVETNAAAPWAPRYDQEALAFNNRIWLLAGWDTVTEMDDVWYSP